MAWQSIYNSYLCSHYRPVMWMLIVTDQHFILLITACLIIQSGHPSKPFNVCLVQTVPSFHASSDAACFFGLTDAFALPNCSVTFWLMGIWQLLIIACVLGNAFTCDQSCYRVDQELRKNKTIQQIRWTEIWKTDTFKST